jgi:nitrite reductase/ring-hydroxylating ferredoxin subunit/uncharacterized membrane protein
MNLPIGNLSHLTERLSTTMPWLDKPASALHSAFDPVFGERGIPLLKDALYGTWLGHPLHPAVTDVPVGCWTSSLILDIAGMEKGADITLKVGTIGALGAALTGVAQWHDVQNLEEPRRLGTLHAMLNITATTLYVASWILRSRGARPAGIALSLTGYGLASVSAMLGADLSYRLGIGVSRVAFNEPSPEWRDALPLDDLADGALTRVEVEGEAIVLLREGASIVAASATCTHVGGPLDEGERNGTCVTCPWHGSEFDLSDGRVIHGPATSPLHAYKTRVENGTVQVSATPS